MTQEQKTLLPERLMLLKSRVDLEYYTPSLADDLRALLQSLEAEKRKVEQIKKITEAVADDKFPTDDDVSDAIVLIVKALKEED